MKSRISLVFTMLCLSSGSLGATGVRLQSMGGSSLYYSLLDEAAVQLFPSTLPLFGDMAFVEGATEWQGANAGSDPKGNTPYHSQGTVFLALTDTQFIGLSAGSYSKHIASFSVNMAFLRWGVLKPAALGLSQADTDALWEGNDAINNAGHWATIFWAMKHNKNRFGANLSLFGDKYEETVAGEVNRRYGGFGVEGRAGFGADFGTHNSFDMALSFDHGSFSDDLRSNGTLATRVKSDKAFSLGLDARARLKAFKGNHLVPYLGFGYGSQGVSWNVVAADAPGFDATLFGVKAGLDLVIQPMEQFFIIPGLGCSYVLASLDPSGAAIEEEISVLTLPFVGIGAEVPLAKWFLLRFGLRHSLDMTSDEQGGDKISVSTADTSFYSGFALRFSSLSMDFNLSPDFWSQGPYVLSGDPLQNGMNASFAMKATW